MRYFLAFVVAVLVSFSVNAQDKKENKKEEVTSFVAYYDNGDVRETGEFDNNGKLSGTWKHYDEAGNLVVKGDYVSGKRQGKWLYWNEDGLKEFLYKDHKIVDVTTWSKNVAINK